MKITLDHNCIINLENRAEIGDKVLKIISDENNNCFVVNIGASEMRQKGVFPDHYEKFEELLEAVGIAHLPRLNPMGIYDVTFWDHCAWVDDEMEKMSDAIEAVLFPVSLNVNIATEGIDSVGGRKWLNRLCDVHTMWCHIQNKNGVFLTTDGNFTKTTKLQELERLGAGRICHPNEL